MPLEVVIMVMLLVVVVVVVMMTVVMVVHYAQGSCYHSHASSWLTPW